MMKTFSCFVLFGSCAAACASFELVLALDNTGRVHRFDGITGAYFGSFGNGSMTGPLGMAIDRSNGRAYVGDVGNVVQVWNYNTGNFINMFSVGSASVSSLWLDNSNNLLIGTNSGIRRYTTSGTFLNAFGGVVDYNGVSQGPDGAYYAVDNSSDRLARFSSSFVFTGSVPLPGAPPAQQWQIQWAGNQGYVADAEKVVMFTAGATAPVLGSSYNPGNMDLVFGVGIGHGPRRYASGGNVGGTAPVIHAFSDLGGVFFPQNTITHSGPSYFVDLQVVAAPEPGSWLAGAVGLSALVLRRRKQS